jgi:hypothetical protein
VEAQTAQSPFSQYSLAHWNGAAQDAPVGLKATHCGLVGSPSQ